jgi:hypothetical protein
VVENSREEFTYDYYKRFMSRLSEAYSFTTFKEGKKTSGETGPFVIMRHDIDMDLEAALRLSKLENDLGISSTYFFMVRCSLYNVFGSSEAEQVKDILTAGHHFGLHFDCSLYADITADNLRLYISKECSLLEDFFHRPVEAISFHRPTALELSGVELEEWPQTYEKVFSERYKYFSDSRGRWAYGHPLESEAFSRRENLHIGVHPVWWTEAPTKPYERLVSLVRQINDRAEQYISHNCQVWNEGRRS